MSEEFNHIYELLDKELMLNGLRRLLIALEDQVSLAKYAVDSGETYTRRPSDGRLLVFGSDSATRMKTLDEYRQQLHEVCSMLAALALPRNCDDLDFHVVDAFYAIYKLLQGSWLSRENRVETAATRTATQQAEDRVLSQRSSGTRDDAHERTNKAPQSEHSLIPESPLPPYVEFMVNLAPELGVTATKMKKDEVRDHIKQRWDADTLGNPSAHLLDVMATLMRPPEAQKGGAKPQAPNP
jgi:hypothetical protein